MVVKCLTCGSLKRFLARECHQLWSEREENVVPTSPSTQAAAAAETHATLEVPPQGASGVAVDEGEFVGMHYCAVDLPLSFLSELLML